MLVIQSLFDENGPSIVCPLDILKYRWQAVFVYNGSMCTKNVAFHCYDKGLSHVVWYLDSITTLYHWPAIARNWQPCQ